MLKHVSTAWLFTWTFWSNHHLKYWSPQNCIYMIILICRMFSAVSRFCSDHKLSWKTFALFTAPSSKWFESLYRIDSNYGNMMIILIIVTVIAVSALLCKSLYGKLGEKEFLSFEVPWQKSVVFAHTCYLSHKHLYMLTIYRMSIWVYNENIHSLSKHLFGFWLEMSVNFHSLLYLMSNIWVISVLHKKF